MFSLRHPDWLAAFSFRCASRLCPWVAIFALIPATVFSGGAKPPPAPAGTEAPAKESEALEVAGQLAERIEDADFRARLSLSLVEFQAQEGRLHVAAALAESIPDYRRGVALAKVAAALARAGKTEESAAVIRTAQAPGNLPHAWQSEAVLAEMAVAWEAAARDEEAAAIADKLTDESARIRARSGRALEKARRGQAYDEAAFQFGPAEARPGPERLQAARALIEIGELKANSAGKNQEALHAVAPLCEQVETILTTSRTASAEEYLDLGLLWRRIGNLEKATRALGHALHQMPPGIDLHDWREGYFAKLVRAYMDAGERAAAGKMLARAREHIPSLHEFYRPPALCQLAEAELAADQVDEAEKTWLEAARIARDNPNPSSQYLGCAQVAFSVARANRPLTSELKNLLAAQVAESAKTAPIVKN